MPYAVLSLLCGAAVIAYVQRSAISVPAGLIGRDFAVDKTSIGLLMGTWYWGYAAFQIPAGWLADRYGSRRVLALSALVWSLLTAWAGLATNFSELLVAWSLMGIAQAGLLPCATKTIGLWFGETRRAWVAGLLACSMSIGAALTPLLTGYLLELLRWQQILVLYAAPGLFWAVLIFLFVGETPPANETAPQIVADQRDWRQLLLNVPMLLLCLQQFFRAAAMVFFNTWFPRFLQETHGVSQFESARLTAWPYGGVIAGFLVGGWMSDRILIRTGNRWWSRQGVGMVGMGLCSLLCFLGSFATAVEWVVGLMSAGAFWASFGGLSGYPAAIEFGGARVATVFSTMNMFGSIGAGLFPVTIALLVETYQNWFIATLLFAGLFAADAVCWALFRPEHARQAHLPRLKELAV
jgi:MFS family permease